VRTRHESDLTKKILFIYLTTIGQEYERNHTMSRPPQLRSSRQTPLIVIAVLSVVLVPVGTATAGSGLGISSVAAVTPAEDGDWWVLERSLQNSGGILYRYTGDWKPTGETHRLRLPNPGDSYHSFSPTDLVPAAGGGWWVVDDDGRVHRFSAEFTYAGESHALRPPASEYNASSAYGLRSARTGGWWVAANRDFWRTDEAWRPANATVGSLRSESGGYPVAVEYGSPTSLWVLEGYLGQGVSLYPLTEDGSEFSPAVTGPGRGSSGKTATVVVGYELEIADTPVDLVKDGSHWWVVDADGQVHRYDRYWRYTGTSHPVGSGDAVSSYPSDVVSPGLLLVPLLGGIWLIPGLVVVVGLRWRRDETDRVDRIQAGAGALLFLYGVVLPPHLVRFVVFANVYLPLVVTGAALLLPTLHVARTTSNTTWRQAKPLVIAYIPVIAGGLAMALPAVRPLIAPY
jgi:hypothetical protein